VFDLSRFGLRERLATGVGLMRATRHATTMHSAAEAVVRYLHNEARHPTTREPACASVRCYMTQPYGNLTADRQTRARHAIGSGFIADEMKCLSLVASAGDQSAGQSAPWSGERAAGPVPLASPRFVAERPLIAQLLHQLGFPLGGVVVPDPAVLRVPEGKNYGVVHVEHARESPYVPPDNEFVDGALAGGNVCSVLGFGGVLARGDALLVMMDVRVPVPADSAENFRTVALDVTALFRSYEGRVFAT
jgi:hypothetical protein